MYNITCNDKADSTGVKSNLWYFESKAVYSAWLECTLLDLLAHKSNNVLCTLRFYNAQRFSLCTSYYVASYIRSTARSKVYSL